MGKFVQLGGSNNPIGYCHYHRFTISKQQMLTKGCLEKNCKRLEKYEDNPYWIEKAKRKAAAKKHRDEKKAAQKAAQQKMDKNNLVKAINYCHNCPPSKKAALEYCSKCQYSKDCMSGIIEMIYDYFHNYSYETFEKFLSEDNILVNKFAFANLKKQARMESTTNEQI